jgi:hypothetical protein
MAHQTNSNFFPTLFCTKQAPFLIQWKTNWDLSFSHQYQDYCQWGCDTAVWYTSKWNHIQPENRHSRFLKTVITLVPHYMLTSQVTTVQKASCYVTLWNQEYVNFGFLLQGSIIPDTGSPRHTDNLLLCLEFFFFFLFVGAEPELCSPDALRPVGLLCTAWFSSPPRHLQRRCTSNDVRDLC